MIVYKKVIYIMLIIFILISCIVLERDTVDSKKEIEIISYNIHSGKNKDMYPSLFDTIDFLKELNSDIICLQEVNESSKVGFQVSSLKEELNMYSHFGANVVDIDSNYGLATYSKYPIIDKNHIYLSSPNEQRGLLHTKVSVGRKKLNIINVHLGLDEDERYTQLNELKEFLGSLNGESYIVLGDFNSSEIEDLGVDVAKYMEKSNILTFSLGLDRIDYMFVSDDIEIIDYEVMIKDMSDHYPIIAKIKL